MACANSPRDSRPEGVSRLRGALWAAKPGVPEVVVAGYAPEGDAEALVRAGAAAVVAKPYQAHELARALRAALAR